MHTATRVTLIGYRGSGKSTVGRLLAEQLGFAFADSDREIEARFGKTIREIFAEDGEPAFRECERTVIAELLNQESVVLAAGGGAVLNEQTRDLMRDAGPVVWLQALPETLAERLATDADSDETRPTLTGAGMLEEIADVLAARKPIYRAAATLIVDTEDRTTEDIAADIASQTKIR